MTERPILFSAPMVRAILDGRKTQTRRVVKPSHVSPEARTFRWQNQTAEEITHSFRCPFGKPGDTLWVRETWCCSMTDGRFDRNGDGSLKYVYRATAPHVMAMDEDGGHRVLKNGREASPWRPSIHMPRVASRITLEVVSVRAERLQEIRLEDCAAEGAPPTVPDYGWDSTETFRALWNRVNGPGAWDKNPWVWVIEFVTHPRSPDA